MLTLVAVVLGGVITILAQIVLDYLRGKSQKRREQDKIKAAVRVIRLYFYAAQHVLRESLETGFWWSGAAGLDVNTRDFRCLGCREVFLSSCSVSVPESVSVMALPG